MPPALDSLAPYESPFPLSAYPRIPSAITRRESDLLAELTVGKRVLEIGTGEGYSAVWMALNGALVESFDPDKNAVFRAGEAAELYGVRQRVVLWQADSLYASQSIQSIQSVSALAFQAAFIDGDHSYIAAAFDLRLAARVVESGGWVIVHDYGAQFEGVTKAVDEILGHLPMRRREGTMYAARLP